MFELSHYEDQRQIRIYFWELSPMWIKIDLDPSGDSAFLVGVVRAFGVPHERTDYNEIVSIIWAASLRATNTASVRIIDMHHPVMPGELQGRYIVFDKQPAVSFISLSHPDITAIEKILIQSSLAAWNFSYLFHFLEGCEEHESCEDYEEWAKTIRRSARWKPRTKLEIGNTRHHPNWSFFRRLDQGVSFFNLGVDPSLFLSPQKENSIRVVMESPTGHLISTGGLKSFVDSKSINRLQKWTKLLGSKVGQPDCAIGIGEISVLPTESHLICLTSSGVITLDQEGQIIRF